MDYMYIYNILLYIFIITTATKKNTRAIYIYIYIDVEYISVIDKFPCSLRQSPVCFLVRHTSSMDRICWSVLT